MKPVLKLITPYSLQLVFCINTLWQVIEFVWSTNNSVMPWFSNVMAVPVLAYFIEFFLNQAWKRKPKALHLKQIGGTQFSPIIEIFKEINPPIWAWLSEGRPPTLNLLVRMRPAINMGFSTSVFILAITMEVTLNCCYECVLCAIVSSQDNWVAALVFYCFKVKTCNYSWIIICSWNL